MKAVKLWVWTRMWEMVWGLVRGSWFWISNPLEEND